MKIVFSIQYNTRFGESLLVHVTDSNTAKERVYGMNTVDGKPGPARLKPQRMSTLQR